MSRALAVLLVLLSALSWSAETFRCPKVCSCDRSKLSVSCFRKNLTEVPVTVDEISLRLDLRSNPLQVLPRGAFSHSPYLTHLNLQRCDIIQVKEGAFRSLGHLVSLNLSHNKIAILYQESFDGLSSLKELSLDHNLIEQIRPGAFTQLGRINMLDLTHNQLVYIPNMAFQGLTSVAWLRLSSNSLNNVADEAFTGLFTLGRLSLDHNELQVFPTHAMSRLRELTHLDLGFNLMTYLGEECVSMSKLTHLYLDHTSLQDLSEHALSGAPRLSHLDLSFNQLRHLDPIVGPAQLTSLNMTGNPTLCDCLLRSLVEWAGLSGVQLSGACSGPPHLSDEPLQAVNSSDLRCRRGDTTPLDELQEERESTGNASPTEKPKQRIRCPPTCDCDANTQHATCEARSLSKVPRGFPPNTRLLDLRRNSFHFLPEGSFRGSSQVVSLHLELCRIHEVEDGAFRGMKKLYYLYLSDNQLTALHADTFAGTPELTYLHLDGNKLGTFPGPAVKLLPALFVLHLERNLLSQVSPAGFLSSVSPSLRELYLSNNSISSISDRALDTPHLAVLHLDHSGLEKVPVEALGPGLRTLTLRGNRLQDVPDLSMLTSLEDVDLQDNLLMCDCSLLHLRRWMEKVSARVKASCANPPEVKGQSVSGVVVFAPCPEMVPPSNQTTVSPSGLFKLSPRVSGEAIRGKSRNKPQKKKKAQRRPAAAQKKKKSS